MRQVIRDCTSVAAVAPVLRNTTVLSSACDLAEYEGVIARIHIGAFGDSQSGSVYIEAELQDSDDNITYGPVADASVDFPAAFSARTGNATGTFCQTKTDAAHDLAGLYEVGYRGIKRYLKINVRLTGTHTVGTILSAGFTRMLPRDLPAR